MDALAYAKLHPKAFHRKFIEKGVRPDRRQLLEYRDIKISTGSVATADASALVRLGDSAVLCGIKLEVKAPEHNTPEAGEVDIKVQAWPLCSPSAKIGAASEEALRLGQSLFRVITTHGMVDLGQLCIAKGRAVWVLRCDVMVLDDSGNLQDAALLAVVAALRTLRIPGHRIAEAVAVDGASRNSGGEGATVELTGEPGQLLEIANTPLSCSFAVFDKQVIVDPTHKEEEVADGQVTITRLADSRLCSVYKPGGLGLTAAQLAFCLKQSKQILAKMHALLDHKLAARSEALSS
eukprot:INCI5942.3.p2 GENE.INCI5942.3~~INCI5942.3.p2  ORF type:complete len:293 (+),score=58.12 INCI5942.3:740-1618(+)